MANPANISRNDITTQIGVAYVMAQAARHSVGSSAALCLEDAEACYTAGDMKHAYQRALRSLSHSVGIFHPDYTEAATMAQTTTTTPQENS